MNRVQITEPRPGTSIKQVSTNKAGVIVAPLRGESVELGRTWVDLGKGPEQISDDDIDIVMRHIRITVRHDPRDPADDLKQVARVRRDLWAHSPVEVDSDNPSCETSRDAARNAYFEFATEFPDEVRRVLHDYGHMGRATMQDLGEVGLVCARCGFLAGYVADCPKCGLRDIDPCPHCGHRVARQCYQPGNGDLFVCPNCRGRVRLEFNPDLGTNGSFSEPVVVVQAAQG